MAKFSSTDRSFCVRAFYQNHNSVINARRAYRKKFDIRKLVDCPSVSNIRKWINAYETTEIAQEPSVSTRIKRARAPQKVSVVKELLTKNPRLSERRLSAAVGVSKTSINRILRTDLKLYTFKTQVVQKLRPGDHQKRCKNRCSQAK